MFTNKPILFSLPRDLRPVIGVPTEIILICVAIKQCRKRTQHQKIQRRFGRAASWRSFSCVTPRSISRPMSCRYTPFRWPRLAKR